MNKFVSLALLIGGIVLITYGIRASESIGSAFSRLFTGAPTDATVWLILGGTVASVWGAISLIRGSKQI